MPRPFANSQAINPALIEGDWLLGIQTGNNTGDSGGLLQMKHIKLSQLTDWVRSTYGAMWRYRGTFSASLPSDPQTNDYFLATATFMVGADTYTENHLYAYNGTSWDDVSDVLTQYALQSQVTDIDDRLTTIEVKVDAMGDGVVFKGSTVRSDLPAASSSNVGWEYWLTDENKFVISNGTTWDTVGMGVVQTPDATDTVNPLSNAATTIMCGELKNAIDSNTARIENLEQEHGSLVVTQYRGTNAVPSGKAKNAKVTTIVGKSRAWNQLAREINTTNYFVEVGTDASIADGVVDIYGNAIVSEPAGKRFSTIAGHSYLVAFEYQNTAVATTRLKNFLKGDGTQVIDLPSASSYTTYAFIFACANSVASDTINFDVSNYTSGNLKVKKLIFRDLTLIFPEGVPSTVAECVQKCPDILNYDAYGYSLVDTTVEGVESKGFNLWDEQTLAGYYNSSGVFVSNNNYFCSKNYIQVKPLTTYYIKYANGLNICEYDSEHTFIKRTFVSDGTLTTQPSTAYLQLSSNNGDSTYNHDICINISSSLNGTYKPWVNPSTRSLPSAQTLRSAGASAEVLTVDSGDETHPIWDVDLSTLIWTKVEGSGYGWWQAPLSGIKRNDGVSVGNVLHAEYPAGTITQATMHPQIATYICPDNTLDKIIVNNYLLGNTEPSGTMYYELATPSADTNIGATPNCMLPTESGGTINTIQTQTPVIDNCLDVAYLAL